MNVVKIISKGPKIITPTKEELTEKVLKTIEEAPDPDGHILIIINKDGSLTYSHKGTDFHLLGALEWIKYTMFKQTEED